MSKALFHRYMILILLSCGLCLFSLWLMPGVSLFWSDSEIWAVTSSRMLFSRFSDFAFGMKPAFHGLLYLTSHLTENAESLIPQLTMRMNAARFLMVINSSLLFYSVLILGKRLTSSWLPGAWAVVMLLFSDFFVTQMWQVRSDMLALPWFLIGFAFAISGRTNLATIPFLISFLMTPKSALLILPVVMVLLFRKPRSVIPLILSFLILGLIQHQALGMALGHFLNETSSAQMGFSWYSSIRWQHVLDAVKVDPWFWILSLISISLAAKHFSSSEMSFKNFYAASALIGLSFLANPSKLPFLIAAHQPLFAVFICVVIFQIMQRPFTQRITARFSKTRQALLTVSLVLVIFASVGKSDSREEYFSNDLRSNAQQRVLAQELDDYIGDFSFANFYDGLGLGSRSQISTHYIGPGQRERNQQFKEHLRDENYLLIAETQKVFLLKSLISDVLVSQYRPSPTGLWRRSLQMEGENNTFTLTPALIAEIRKVFALILRPETPLYLESADHVIAQEVFLVPKSKTQKRTRLELPLSWASLLQNEGARIEVKGHELLYLTPFPPMTSSTALTFFDLFRFRPLER